MIILDMKNYNTILIEKQLKYQHHNYEYLPGQEILQSNQQQLINQAKFTYSPFGKEKIETIKNQREKQIKAIQDQRHAKSNKKNMILMMEIAYESQGKNKYLINQQTKGVTK